MTENDMKLSHYYREKIAHGGGEYYSQLIDIFTSAIGSPSTYVLSPVNEGESIDRRTLEELNSSGGITWEYVGECLPDNS